MIELHGIVPALITPLDENENLNERSLRRLVNHVIDGGVHGVFALGSQGEFWAFSYEEKRRILEIVVDETRRRVPVYGGTAAITTREVINLTQMAEAAGVDAVSILTPYFLHPNPRELYDHYAAIAKATSLPVVLYSNPSRTGVHLTADTVSELARIKNVVGIKDSSGDLSVSAEYVRATPSDFSVVMGRDSLILEGLLSGCAGAIAATANVAPHLAVQIYECYQTGDTEGARKAQDRLSLLRNAFAWGTFPVVIKEAANLIGLKAGPARRPVGSLSDEARARLAEVLRGLALL